MKTLGDIESSPNRLAEEYPHYTSPDSNIFPFHKKEFWANLDADRLSRLAGDFSDVSVLLLKSGLAAVRNGLDHFRRSDNFPSLDAMLACEARVRQAVEVADIKRLWPKRWWLEARASTNVGQITETFVAERGEKYVANYPSVLVSLPDADYGQPIIIAYENLLGQANSTIFFHVVDDSDYVEMWKSYPARPDISSKDAVEFVEPEGQSPSQLQ